ncbi:hypothetical protein CEQ90_11670 [Lewinellaceae bacterium SD302]|nr:hypothetical protein CEQ90_11670 [Lewinellaceae bacterium SD302]
MRKIPILLVMTPTHLTILAVLGWSLTLYFGFYRYRQYVWSRRKVQYDLFTRINQRSDRLFLSLNIMLALPRKGAKGQAKFAGLRHKYLEGIREKTILLASTQLPEELAVFWLRGILAELDQLDQRDDQFLRKLNDYATRHRIAQRELGLLLDYRQQDNAPGIEQLLGSMTA